MTKCFAWFCSNFLMFCLFVKIKSDSEEYQAACRLWQVYLQTRTEFVQPGDGDDEEEDGEDIVDNSGMSAEEEVDCIATKCSS